VHTENAEPISELSVTNSMRLGEIFQLSIANTGRTIFSPGRLIGHLLTILLIVFSTGCACHQSVCPDDCLPTMMPQLTSCQTTSPPCLKLLTWNIWMMPPWTGQSHCNERRARAIATELLRQDFDIVCLEKVFDGGARRVLEKALDARYPCRYGPANSSLSIKPVNSGVWVLSRFPLRCYREIEFRDCAGIECFSRKGAIRLGGDFLGHPFYIVATHLQGEEGPNSTPEHQLVRNKQMEQINRELIGSVNDPHAPVFICGDFATPRYDDEDPPQETSGYRFMIQTFCGTNGPSDRITLDDNSWRNDLADDNSGRTAELDYILIRTNGVALQAEWTRLIMRHMGWDGHTCRQDLSYRYAVEASISFP
jgi:endonuclease/exonuclease/phosphatase family metal-dependent hydrolase